MSDRDRTAPTSGRGPDRLNGWKEIASYLGKSVRTAERWERLYGLPVHRLEPAGGEVVFAIKAEIDEWMLTSHARAAAGDPDHVSTSQAAATGPEWRAGPHDTPGPTPTATAGRGQAVADAQPSVNARRASRGLRWAAALICVLAAVAAGAWWWKGRNAEPRAPAIALSWQRAGESRVPRKTESGIVIDPAYVELHDGDLFFHYEKQSSRWQAAPYAFARLPMPLASPSVSFRLRPKADGRLGHLAGVMDAASGFSCEAGERPGWARRCRPSEGIAVLVARTSAAYAGSGLTILVFTGSAVSESGHRDIGFPFEPGRSYSVALSVEAGLVTAAASDGTKVETVTLRPKVLPERFDQVFVADRDAGVSNSASPGRYVLAVEDFTVEDLVHPVRFDVLPEAVRTDGSARRFDRVPLAFYSTPSVDATAIDPATIRLSGVALPAEAGSVRYDCRQRDVDGDGLRDLVCHVDGTVLLGPAEGRVVSLEGRTAFGRAVRGQQFIRLTP